MRAVPLMLNERRWDHEGCFDVLVVAHGTTSTKPVVIEGDTLSIQGGRESEAFTFRSVD